MHEIWSVNSQEELSKLLPPDVAFKAKMHQIRFRLGLRPRPIRGAYSAPPDALTGLKGGLGEEAARGGAII